MSAQTFVSNLPVVDTATLDEDEQHCKICCSKYYTSQGSIAEGPVELPCKHVFGEGCLKTWLSTHNSCPICRHALFSTTETEDFFNQLRSDEVLDIMEDLQNLHSRIVRLAAQLYGDAGDLADRENGGAPFLCVERRSKRLPSSGGTGRRASFA